MLTRGPTNVLLAAGVAMCLALASGCRPDTPPIPPPPTEPPSPTTPAAHTEALDAYRRMWGALVNAAAAANPDDPTLRRFADGDALAILVAALYVHRMRGEVVLGEVALSPSAVDRGVGALDVGITDCVDTSLWLTYRDTGGLVDTTPGGRRAASATVVDTTNGWMVSTLDIGEVGTC